MSFLVFDAQFEQAIRDKVKRSTIRSTFTASPGYERELLIHDGKGVYQSLAKVRIVSVRDVEIKAGGGWCVNRAALWDNEKRALAKSEGFLTFEEMHGYIVHIYRLPFVGKLIEWEYL